MLVVPEGLLHPYFPVAAVGGVARLSLISVDHKPAGIVPVPAAPAAGGPGSDAVKVVDGGGSVGSHGGGQPHGVIQAGDSAAGVAGAGKADAIAGGVGGGGNSVVDGIVHIPLVCAVVVCLRVCHACDPDVISYSRSTAHPLQIEHACPDVDRACAPGGADVGCPDVARADVHGLAVSAPDGLDVYRSADDPVYRILQIGQCLLQLGQIVHLGSAVVEGPGRLTSNGGNFCGAQCFVVHPQIAHLPYKIVVRIAGVTDVVLGEGLHLSQHSGPISIGAHSDGSVHIYRCAASVCADHQHHGMPRPGGDSAGNRCIDCLHLRATIVCGGNAPLREVQVSFCGPLRRVGRLVKLQKSCPVTVPGGAGGVRHDVQSDGHSVAVRDAKPLKQIFRQLDVVLVLGYRASRGGTQSAVRKAPAAHDGAGSATEHIRHIGGQGVVGFEVRGWIIVVYDDIHRLGVGGIESLVLGLGQRRHLGIRSQDFLSIVFYLLGDLLGIAVQVLCLVIEGQAVLIPGIGLVGIGLAFFRRILGLFHQPLDGFILIGAGKGSVVDGVFPHVQADGHGLHHIIPLDDLHHKILGARHPTHLGGQGDVGGVPLPLLGVVHAGAVLLFHPHVDGITGGDVPFPVVFPEVDGDYPHFGIVLGAFHLHRLYRSPGQVCVHMGDNVGFIHDWH